MKNKVQDMLDKICEMTDLIMDFDEDDTKKNEMINTRADKLAAQAKQYFDGCKVILQAVALKAKVEGATEIELPPLLLNSSNNEKPKPP